MHTLTRACKDEQTSKLGVVVVLAPIVIAVIVKVVAAAAAVKLVVN